MTSGKRPDTRLVDLAREAGITRQGMDLRVRRGLTGDALTAKPRRGAHMITHEGRTLTIAAWARELDLPVQTLYNRERRGMSPAEILSTGRLRSGPRSADRVTVVLLPGYVEGMSPGRWIEAQIDRSYR